jgi:hypothetical protein
VVGAVGAVRAVGARGARGAGMAVGAVRAEQSRRLGHVHEYEHMIAALMHAAPRALWCPQATLAAARAAVRRLWSVPPHGRVSWGCKASLICGACK